MPRLARVKVAADRVIRTTVGLRPFRPSGFVVRAEKLGEKTVIHNYGHGGSGITLSWGTAQLAADLADGVDAGPARDCAVIGCGVIGLSTARLLQLRGYRPTIYTQAMPPNTTTNMAGGLWEPVSLYDLERVTPEFRTQYGSAARFSFRYFQWLTGADYAVRWLPLYTLSMRGPHGNPAANDPASEVELLYPEGRQLTTAENPFATPFAHRRHSMLIEPAPYLTALIRDFHLAGGHIIVKTFGSVNDIAALPERLIFNCTGLGAKSLFGDPELTPIRGQLVVLLPQPEIDYMTLGTGNSYMFPRRDGILLGGSFDRGDSNLEPDAAISERILRENRAVFDGMRASV
jgi:glycine/D-amino acid oxidase-like deaminating enzyme